MKPSAIACRIEYRWNGTNLSSPAASTIFSPNRSSVLAFGVAVNAKNDRLACDPRACADASSRSSVSRAASSAWASASSASSSA